MENCVYEDLDGDMNDEEIGIANKYWDAEDFFLKGKMETEPETALSGFADVVKMSRNHDNWCLIALERTVQIYCSRGEHEKIKDVHREMLKFTKSPYFYSSITSITDFVSSSFSDNFDLLEEFYQTTLQTLEESKGSSQALWFKTNLKLCNTLFDLRKYPQISKILKELHRYCQNEDGTYAKNKGSQVFEVFANEFLLYIETNDNKDLKMQQLYQKAFSGKFDTSDHTVIGIVRECGGKMHLAERQWEEAAIDFRAAFANYNLARNQRRIKCLKYGLLANMMGSKVNPFDRETARRYENNPEILAMKALIEAYEKNDFAEFQRILKSMDDPFIKTYYMEDLDMLKKVRTQVLLNLIKPYANIGIQFISTKLGMSETEVTELLRSLILDSQIDGSIDGVNGYLLLTKL
ncbi:predicted protein [Arabidopsis lyrata subsp. lyrata]|uniref:Predicted protein n=1 Tax=Arabidopsis lyrata subsp. lyrata TaxID=81972 RepID=D7MMW8_ARALL|nr:predicted protein [Arabidopsis lyrata subsp. lyrata]